MPKCYSKAPDEVTDRAQHLIACFYPMLRDAGLRIDILSCASDDEDCDHALMHQGYPADALIRVLDSKQRAKGSGDVEIIIDEASYLTKTDAEKDALIDHELHHVELRLNKKGRVKLDEHGRPKCGMKKHDFQLGHFIEIAKRHGAASGEVQQMTRIYLEHKQTLFSFAMTQDRLEAATEPSDKVKAIAKEILDASPAVQSAARNLVNTLRKNNVTMTMTSGDEKVTVA